MYISNTGRNKEREKKEKDKDTERNLARKQYDMISEIEGSIGKLCVVISETYYSCK